MMSGIEEYIQYQSDDCGCPEETFVYGLASIIMHLDPDGSGTAYVDFGEWQFEVDLQCSSMYELRKEVTKRIDELPVCE